jgi:hypothetical protein
MRTLKTEAPGTKSANRGKTRKKDTAVTRTYADRRLLEPGWAGQLSDSEIEFIRRELKLHRSLWRRWGYDGAMIRGVSIPAATLRRIAIHGLS